MRLNWWPGTLRMLLNVAERKGNEGEVWRMRGKVKTVQRTQHTLYQIPAAVPSPRAQKVGMCVVKNYKDTILHKLTTVTVISSQEYNIVI